MRICVLLQGPTCLSLQDALNSSSCGHLLQVAALQTRRVFLTCAVLQGRAAVDVGPHGQYRVCIKMVDRHVGLGLQRCVLQKGRGVHHRSNGGLPWTGSSKASHASAHAHTLSSIQAILLICTTQPPS